MSKIKNTKFQSLKSDILKILKTQNIALNIKQISWRLNLKGGAYKKVIASTLRRLLKDKLIVNINDHKYRYNQSSQLLTGTIEINKSGHGFVTLLGYQNDIFIKNKNRLNSLNLDTVSIQILGNIRGRVEGKVNRVVKRNSTKFIGKISKEGLNYFFIADKNRAGSDFFIPKKHLCGAKHNNRVIVNFLDWPESAKCPFGSVSRVLEDSPSLKLEIESNIELYDIQANFSENIKQEINQVSNNIDEKTIRQRKDFRNLSTFTIDPIDAKDFDDALSVKFLKNKNICIGVHIADVSQYVVPGSSIDKEARLRAFSVYFPGTVIPMLPEKLSNLVCSLRPKEEKLAFSVSIEFNSNLKIIENISFDKSVIKSNKRFTYEEVDVVLMAGEGEFYKELCVLNKIAQNVRKERMSNGSINFERSSISFELNKSGEPCSVIKKPSLNAHHLVEEFMLLANKFVAEKLGDFHPTIYRVHDLPNQEKIKDLAKYLNQILPNKKININHKNLSKKINTLMISSSPKVHKDTVTSFVLRAMSKAKYDIKNLGHYGLGFKKYTHFTSPIRRYSDLIVHRLLGAAVQNKKISIENIGRDCIYFSNVERKYIELERKINKFIQLKLLQESVGESFYGAVSGLTNWGMYVELDGGKGEGLVSINKIGNEKYSYNDARFCLIGKKTGKKYILGQEVCVEILAINLTAGEMDLKILS